MADTVTTTSHKCSTAISKGGTDHPTTLTIEWDISDEAIRALAARTLVIRAQDIWRKAGSIPATETVTASSLTAKRSRAPRAPMTADAAVAALPPAELIAALKRAGALTPDVLKALRSEKA